MFPGLYLSSSIASVAGKALLLGGHLILDSSSQGLVLSLSPRVHARIESLSESLLPSQVKNTWPALLCHRQHALVSFENPQFADLFSGHFLFLCSQQAHFSVSDCIFELRSISIRLFSSHNVLCLFSGLSSQSLSYKSVLSPSFFHLAVYFALEYLFQTQPERLDFSFKLTSYTEESFYSKMHVSPTQFLYKSIHSSHFSFLRTLQSPLILAHFRSLACLSLN